MKKLNLRDCIEISLETKKTVELPCEIVLREDDSIFFAHSVFISYREITFICDTADVSYSVDTLNGVDNFLNLYSIVKE